MTGILMMSVGNSYGYKPVNTVAPAVTGTTTFGQTLSCSTGTWNAAPPSITYTYQWYRSPSTSIGGATSSTYVLVAADVGNTLYCTVTATNAVGVTSANSNTTATVAAAVPGAPTIGTATATGPTTATVTYTAPASNGGATITLYTATSSPGGLTGTLATAGSGTITVSGLSVGTAYTFTVKATNSAGQSAASGASNSITPVLNIGDAYQGGYYSGKYSLGGTTYYLIVAPIATGQSNKQFSINTTSGTGGNNNEDGYTNSNNMNNSNFPAAQWARGLNIGGYTDWYMPSQNELCTVYYFLKPGTGTNDTASGINYNAVAPQPNGTNFTSGNPSQTTAAAFQTGGAEALSTSRYYTSTDQNPYAYQQIFSNGSQVYVYGNRTVSLNVRAVRKVAV
jgi:hypothetical protein